MLRYNLAARAWTDVCFQALHIMTGLVTFS